MVKIYRKCPERHNENHSPHFVVYITILFNYFTIVFFNVAAMLNWMKTEWSHDAACTFWRCITGPCTNARHI